MILGDAEVIDAPATSTKGKAEVINFLTKVTYGFVIKGNGTLLLLEQQLV